MRKIAVLMCVGATLFLFFGCQKNYTHGVYELEITTSMISNNSVGNNWSKAFTYNDKTIYSGECWIVPLDTIKTVTINAAVTEIDKWPDVGSVSMSVVLVDGFQISENVTVIENKGTYKGNKAQWKITCKVKLIEKTAYK